MRQKKSRIREFEFHYLTELTARGIKPLSRWEGPLSDRSRKLLRGRSLSVETVSRMTESGRRVEETVSARLAGTPACTAADSGIR